MRGADVVGAVPGGAPPLQHARCRRRRDDRGSHLQDMVFGVQRLEMSNFRDYTAAPTTGAGYTAYNQRTSWLRGGKGSGPTTGSRCSAPSFLRSARLAHEANARTDVVSIGETSADSILSLKINVRCGEILPRILQIGSLAIPNIS